jgi:hypothetical protein
MPWLSRPNSPEQDAMPVNDSANRNPKGSDSSMVNFIPAQIDGLCGTMPAHQKQAAWGLLLGDVQILIQNMCTLPAMLRAMCSTTVLRKLFKNPLDARDTLIQSFLAIVQMWMLAVAVPAFLILPGTLFAASMSAFWLITLAITWPLSCSKMVVYNHQRAPMTDDFSDERWIYVNGMMCR